MGIQHGPRWHRSCRAHRLLRPAGVRANTASHPSLPPCRRALAGEPGGVRSAREIAARPGPLRFVLIAARGRRQVRCTRPSPTLDGHISISSGLKLNPPSARGRPSRSRSPIRSYMSPETAPAADPRRNENARVRCGPGTPVSRGAKTAAALRHFWFLAIPAVLSSSLGRLVKLIQSRCCIKT